MKEQFEDLNKQDIPVRLARFRQKNGSLDQGLESLDIAFHNPLLYIPRKV